MKVLRQLQELCIALIVLHTGAEITLTVITPQETLLINDLSVEIDFECGSRVTFMCETKPYIDTAEWQVNSTIYAACYSILCFNYPPYPAYHEFSMSLATETFNLTTDPITLAARRSVYSCSNGLTALSVDAIVKVYVKNDTLEMDTSTANQITLTTGCVYPYGKDDLTFKWFISKDRVILEQSQFVRDKVQKITDFACSETSDCAGAETVQFNSTMVVDIFETGDEYHICVTVQHIDEPNRPPAVHCSVKTYRVSSYTTDGSAKTYVYWIMFSISLGITRIIFFQKFIYLFGEVDRSNMWISLAGCILPGLGLFLHICKTDVCCCYLKIFMKWIYFLLSVVVIGIDVAIIVVYLVKEQLTQSCIYYPVAFSYICVSLIVNATIVKCIYARYRCKKCANKSDYVCKSCKLIYCNDCVKQDPEMICVCIKCTKCERKSVFICKLCNKKYCKDCMSQDGCITEQQMTCGSCEEAQIEMKSYCCKCKKFLCNDCSKDHKCNGILLKHPQHGTEREEDTFCEKEHTTRNSACGYCVKCDCYLCSTCLKSHAEQQLILIQRHSGKTYLCKMCQKQENCFPVECVDLGSFTISCAECFERKDKAETESSEDYYKLAEVQRRNLSKKKFCQIHEIPFSDQKDKVKSNVYCFICKAYMCNICYINHRRLGSVWRKNEKWKHWNRLSFKGFERTATGSKWIICTLIPVFGFIYGIVQLCRHKHSYKVGQGGNE